MATRRCILIGISGTTNSGKSTLASRLCAELPRATHMCQDHYFYEPKDPRVPKREDGFENWDVLEAMDMTKMMNDVTTWIRDHEALAKPSVLVIEGFLILNYRPLSQLLDKKFFITLDQDTCIQRRKTRTYNPPDTPGYFESVVWPMYQKHLEDLTDQHDIEYIDGSSHLDTLYTTILNGIRDTKALKAMLDE